MLADSPNPIAINSPSELPPTLIPWQQRIGNQRDWMWRGWRIRYTYIRPQQDLANLPPLILLHGFGASIGHWRHNLSELAQHRPVYALDLLGFGASEKAVTTYDVQLWRSQIYDFWRSLIRRPVILVGNSIGSLVCLGAAAEHPEMAAGIAMLSLPDTSVREEAMPPPMRPIVSTIEGIFTAPWILKALFYYVRRPKIVQPWAAIAYGDAKAVTAELVEILSGPAQEPGAAQAFARIIKGMTSSAFGPKVKTVLPKLEVPVLLIWGQKDRMIPPVLGRQFAGYNPHVRLVELDEAGHCPHDECPELVNQEILNWLQAESI